MRHGLMLQLNEQLVLDDIHTHGNTTRPEIAARLGLSSATVSRIIRRLAGRDLVREEPGISTGGRPRTAISFNARSGCVIGIDLGGTKCHAMLADLSGDLLVEEIRASDADGSPFETMVASIRRLIGHRERAGAPVKALAVGVPAIVDANTGRAVGGPNVHWDGFPLVARLGAELDVPFVVDNDVNLAALGHAWRGAARGHADFFVLSLGTGIGGAVVADGRLLKGHRSGAGEIGFMVLSRELLRASRPGGLGSFETLASGVGMAARARHLLDHTDEPSVLRHTSGPPDPRDVIEAAVQGDRLASDIVSAMVDQVAMAVIAISSICDPEIVILDGSVGRALGHWASEIRALAGHHLPIPPEVVVSTLGGEATAIGAVAAALDLSRTRLDEVASQTVDGPDHRSSRSPFLDQLVAP
jgi:glucokinase